MDQNRAETNGRETALRLPAAQQPHMPPVERLLPSGAASPSLRQRSIVHSSRRSSENLPPQVDRCWPM